MPSAPSLNRPPRAPLQRQTGVEKGLTFGSTFARPPAPRQGPTAFDRNALTGAAVKEATRGNPGTQGPRTDTRQVSPQAPPGGRPQTPPRANRPNPGNNPLTNRPPAPGSVRSTGMRTGPTPGPVSGPPPGAPDPGTPDTSAETFSIPLVPADETAKAEATGVYNDATTQANTGIQSAAEAYGDPGLMNQWGLPAGTVNPNSALAMAALNAQVQSQRATDAHERTNTVFSSLNQRDQGLVTSAERRSQLAGYQRYQNALAKFNAAMSTAQEARTKAFDAANLDERQTAINNLPTAETTGSGGFQGGSNNITSKVPIKTSTVTPKTGKVPTLKNPKTTKLTKAGKSRSTRIGTSSGSKSVGKVKTGVRRISGGKARR